jgi:hypothetical protein
MEWNGHVLGCVRTRFRQGYQAAFDQVGNGYVCTGAMPGRFRSNAQLRNAEARQDDAVVAASTHHNGVGLGRAITAKARERSRATLLLVSSPGTNLRSIHDCGYYVSKITKRGAPHSGLLLRPRAVPYFFAQDDGFGNLFHRLALLAALTLNA